MNVFTPWVTRIAAIALGALLLCLPAAFNGGPILYPDSDAYYSGGANLIGELLGAETSAPQTEPAAEAQAEPFAAAAEPSPPQPLQVTTIAARSVFFGILTFLFSFAHLWGLVLLQALVASVVLWRCARAFASDDELRLFAALVALALVATTLPWFVGFIMPDLWVSFPLILLTLFMFGPQQPSRLDLAGLLVITAMAAAFHTSSLLVLAAAAVLAATLAWWAGAQRTRLLGVTGAAALGIVCALSAAAAFGIIAERHFGERLRMPIFVSARILADGPARGYLRDACTEDPSRYTLCRFTALPLDNYDEILFSTDPAKGVWTLSDYETRLALADEQPRFVIAAFASDPLGQLGASLSHGLRLFANVGLDEALTNQWRIWQGDPYWSTLPIFGIMGERPRVCFDEPSRCEAPLVTRVADIVVTLAFWAALMFVIWQVVRTKPWAAPPGERARIEATALAFIVVALAVNTIICGALAGEYERYQARTAWILPVFAFLVIAPWTNWLRRPK